MVDFKHLIGKEVVWSGTVLDKETGAVNNYILFSDGRGMLVPDPDLGQPTSMLDDAKQTLSTIVSEKFDEAVGILALAELLQHRAFTSWVNKIEAAKEEKEKIAKVQAMKLPAEKEFEAMMQEDLPPNAAMVVEVIGGGGPLEKPEVPSGAPNT